MKRFALILAIALILVIGIIALAGCGKKNEGIIGSWKHSTGYVYTFNNDKTGSYSFGDAKMEFTYEDDGSKVSILYTGNTIASDYEYKIEGNKLIIKDSLGADVEYIKQ